MPGPGKRFAKGHDGGPGRPKGSGYVELCKEWADKKGWRKLMTIADGEPFTQLVSGGSQSGQESGTLPADGKLQLTAIQTLLAYGYGRPKETVELNVLGDLADDLKKARERRDA